MKNLQKLKLKTKMRANQVLEKSILVQHPSKNLQLRLLKSRFLLKFKKLTTPLRILRSRKKRKKKRSSRMIAMWTWMMHLVTWLAHSVT